MPGAIAGSWIPTLLVTFLGTLWGAHFTIIKIAVASGLSVGCIIVGTACGAAVALVAISSLRRRLPPLSLRHLRFYAMCAVLSYGLPFFLELTAAKYLAAGMLTIIITMDPIFTTVIAVLLRSETVSRARAFGLAIAAAAVLIILLPGTALPSPELLGWVLLAFGVPASYAVYHTYVASAWPAGLDAWQAGTGEALLSLLVFLPLVAMQNEPCGLSSGWNAGHWTIVFMALSGVLEAYLYFEIVRRAGAVFVSQAGFVTVITGMLFGIAIFGEEPNRWLWLSAGCLICSLYLTRTAGRSER
ncbi:MAG: DMT family transporter [Geminicoccaceae bacterium]